MPDENISITRALKELKLLSDRITKKIAHAQFVDIYQGRSPNAAIVSKKTKTEFETNSKEQLQSINDLIKRRNDIKSAILISNSKTTVKIAGTPYLVVEAIDRKQSITYEIQLLDKLRVDWNKAKVNIDQTRGSLEAQIKTMLEQSLGSDKKIESDTYKQIADPIYEANEFKLIDPLKVEKLIEDMDKKIDEFQAEVDFVLSESNSQTEITI